MNNQLKTVCYSLHLECSPILMCLEVRLVKGNGSWGHYMYHWIHPLMSSITECGEEWLKRWFSGNRTWKEQISFSTLLASLSVSYSLGHRQLSLLRTFQHTVSTLEQLTRDSNHEPKETSPPLRQKYQILSFKNGKVTNTPQKNDNPLEHTKMQHLK